MSHIALDSELTLRHAAGEPVSVRATALAVTETDGKISECCLTFEVSPEVYRRIDEQALFNLKPEERVTMPDAEFDPDRNIEIQARLAPETLVLLSTHATTPAAAEYLLEQNQNHPDSPLLATENWFALYVTQQEPLPPGMEGELKIGYSTTWVDPTPQPPPRPRGGGEERGSHFRNV
jgi:hypothetical protein